MTARKTMHPTSPADAGAFFLTQPLRLLGVLSHHNNGRGVGLYHIHHGELPPSRDADGLHRLESNQERLEDSARGITRVPRQRPGRMNKANAFAALQRPVYTDRLLTVASLAMHGLRKPPSREAGRGP